MDVVIHLECFSIKQLPIYTQLPTFLWEGIIKYKSHCYHVSLEIPQSVYVFTYQHTCQYQFIRKDKIHSIILAVFCIVFVSCHIPLHFCDCHSCYLNISSFLPNELDSEQAPWSLIHMCFSLGFAGCNLCGSGPSKMESSSSLSPKADGHMKLSHGC